MTGFQFKLLRKFFEISQTTIAEKFDRSRGYCQKIERGLLVPWDVEGVLLKLTGFSYKDEDELKEFVEKIREDLAYRGLIYLKPDFRPDWSELFDKPNLWLTESQLFDRYIKSYGRVHKKTFIRILNHGVSLGKIKEYQLKKAWGYMLSPLNSV
jgi:hypothetical protein